MCGQQWLTDLSRCFSQGDIDYVLIFNFFRNLRAIIDEFKPHKCFFVLEGHPQFRYDLYPEYKANRIIKTASKKDTYEKFNNSKREIIRLLNHLPITRARASAYECDDVIATLCENMKDESLIIISNDSDYIQLLQRDYRSCKIYNSIKKEFMKAPDYPYVAWKSLNGDKSDNIKSLLTPKKAVNVITNPSLFKEFMSNEENRSNFSINKDLIEFRSVPEDEIEITDGIKNFNSLKEEFIQMRFESLVEEFTWRNYCNTFNYLKF
jgi:5'-3' exonuclease